MSKIIFALKAAAVLLIGAVFMLAMVVIGIGALIECGVKSLIYQNPGYSKRKEVNGGK